MRCDQARLLVVGLIKTVWQALRYAEEAIAPVASTHALHTDLTLKPRPKIRGIRELNFEIPQWDLHR
jgi:hypothetical protein